MMIPVNGTRNDFYFADNNTEGENGPYYYQTTLYKVLVVFAFALVMVIICFGNLLVIITYACVQKLQTRGNIFMIRLAVADLVLGFQIIFQIVSIFIPLKSLTLCILRYSLLSVSSFACNLTLLVLTVERYFAVFHPLKYHTCDIKKWFYGITALIWTPAFIFGFLIPFVWHKDWTYEKSHGCEFSVILKEDFITWFISLPFILSTVSILVLYTKIIKEIRKQKNRIGSRNANRILTPQNAIDRHTPISSQIIKLCKTVALIEFCYLVCWVPFMLFIAIHALMRLEYSVIAINVRFCLGILLAVNSALNPFIYAVRTPDFRKAIRKAVTGH
ncbi:beta-1 adrenergic receptor-like isoform X1 [Lingula anatina]|uniref:Beta-1 adrenergic receptor-like isoform X1 n=1 Tax=Lingula anatina TaxID=7574 RepID=A0A1S3J8E2_LINAN|nr:beta-1 adrenergic receptor-like isoform X2 [Lingula anatina]XP_013406135.1 beta-1 adrenergic receptor-like isoform X1 [Lingula anatina]|eukprot:XP_013406134.1 beta-1 adrenergic receptor-like isoform X2 [Lingula anatina]